MAKKLSQQISAKRLAEVGERIYEKTLRDKLEPHYTGQIVAIEVNSGDYFLGETLHQASANAKEKYPNNLFHFVKVGYPAVYSFASGASIATLSS